MLYDFLNQEISNTIEEILDIRLTYVLYSGTDTDTRTGTGTRTRTRTRMGTDTGTGTVLPAVMRVGGLGGRRRTGLKSSKCKLSRIGVDY